VTLAGSNLQVYVPHRCELAELLREARDLLQVTSQEQAIQALSGHLKINNKQALALLIEARSVIHKEGEEQRIAEAKREQEQIVRQAKLDEEARLERERADRQLRMEQARLEQEAETERARLAHEASLERSRLESEATLARIQADREERERLAREEQEQRIRQAKVDQGELFIGLAGNATVSLEEAASVLGYETRYIARLRNEGKLRHNPRRDDQITVASIRAYHASHKRRKEPVNVPLTEYPSNGHSTSDTDPMQALVPFTVGN